MRLTDSDGNIHKAAANYYHRPTTPTVLKIEKTENETIIKGSMGTVVIRDNPGFDNPITDEMGQTEKMKSFKPIVLPTRLNIVRFMQDFLVKHFNLSQDQLMEDFTEEMILQELDSFFKH